MSLLQSLLSWDRTGQLDNGEHRWQGWPHPENRQNWRAGMILVWNPVASMPQSDSCRLLYIFSAEKTNRLRRSFWHSESKVLGTVYWRKGISGWWSVLILQSLCNDLCLVTIYLASTTCWLYTCSSCLQHMSLASTWLMLYSQHRL